MERGSGFVGGGGGQSTGSSPERFGRARIVWPGFMLRMKPETGCNGNSDWVRELAFSARKVGRNGAFLRINLHTKIYTYKRAGTFVFPIFFPV
jgi:hypothetical protein